MLAWTPYDESKQAEEMNLSVLQNPVPVLPIVWLLLQSNKFLEGIVEIIFLLISPSTDWLFLGIII